MDSRGARLARGVVAASVSTLVAAFSHAAGGGQFPAAALLVLGFVFATLFCVAISGRRATWARLTPAVLVAQGLFHVVFSLGGAAAGSAQLVTGAHAHHGAAAMGGGSVIPGTTAMGTSPAADMGVAMLAAHLLAAVVTITGLKFGEAAFWGLFAAARVPLRFLLLGIHLRPQPLPTPSLAVAGSGFSPSRLLVHLRADPLRGPPPAAATA